MAQTERIASINNAIELCHRIMYLITRCRQTGSTTAIANIDDVQIVTFDKRQAATLKRQKPGLECIVMNDMPYALPSIKRSKLVFDNYAIHQLADICCHALHARKHIASDDMLYANLASVADYLQTLATANWLTRLRWLIFGFKIPKHIEDIFNAIARELYNDFNWG